jgi:HlyD family secretion protein
MSTDSSTVTEPPKPARKPTEQEQPQTTPPAPQKRSKAAVRILLVVVLIAAAVLLWRFLAAPGVPANIVQLSGRIEGDDSAVAPKTAGRILAITVREGDQVKADQIIATLDDEQVRAREQQARAAFVGAEAKSAAARVQISILEEQLKQYGLQTEQSRADAEGRVRQAEADLAAAEADLKQQEAVYDLAVFDRDAYTRLAKTGAVSERQGRQSATTADQQGAALAATRRKVEAARGALQIARANLTTPGIRDSQVSATKRQILQQQSEIASAAADAQQAQFELQEALANRADLTIKAPFDGTVITRSAEPGEVITAGTAVITLLDLNTVYLRGYVPEGSIGRVKLGQPAHIYLDSNPNRAVDAFVSRIDPQATFTPENTYFRDDRVKQVVGVKLQLKGAIGFAKPGMPADGEILVEGNSWPAHKSK